MSPYDTRDIIHGFISYDDWEREIINHPIFQRLRRVKQLSLTDMVYPGANHTRFEHSLGVMKLATLLYDTIVRKREKFLKDELRFDDAGLKRDRRIVRFAALLHDIGHSPFSHAGEELMPFIPEGHPKYTKEKGAKFSHEDYSIAIIKTFFKDIIENHKENDNYDLKVEDITALLGDESVKVKRSHVWKNLISSQLDADRADYLIRDSLHMGVRYGMYDMDRLINTMNLAISEMGTNLVVEEGGWHVAESLVICRYQMFAQVYFHRTRRAYDHHLEKAMKNILLNSADRSGYFPPPVDVDNLQKYLHFDDWTMGGLFKEGLGGEQGNIILNRNHDKCVYETGEVPSERELTEIKDVYDKFQTEISFDDSAEKSWYKTGKEDILILYGFGDKEENLRPLSTISSIVKSMQPIKQKRIYVKSESKEHVKAKINEFLRGWKS
jgi:HD superfamily phosphohydrolase